MKNSEITMLIIVGTIICLCFISFLIYLIVLVSKLKQENKNTEKEYINLYNQKEGINKKWIQEIEKNSTLEYEIMWLKESNKREYQVLLEKNRNLVLKKDTEKEHLINKIESLSEELETEKELNNKHLESIDTLKLRKNINNEEFYLCLLRTYKNFTKIDSSIDGRTKAFKDFILTKEAIEYLILLLSDEITENSNIVKKLNLISKEQKLKTILNKERIKNTEIGNYDLIVENNQIIFKNRLK